MFSNTFVCIFQMDLAGLFLKIGVKNQRMALLLTDAQIPDEQILVWINLFLASGDIQNLQQPLSVWNKPFTVIMSFIFIVHHDFFINVRHQTSSALFCCYFLRRNFRALQWWRGWEYCICCKSWSTRPRTPGQQRKLLEVLYNPGATTIHGEAFKMNSPVFLKQQGFLCVS